jgi:hypothetical protein
VIMWQHATKPRSRARTSRERLIYAYYPEALQTTYGSRPLRTER